MHGQVLNFGLRGWLTIDLNGRIQAKNTFPANSNQYRFNNEFDREL
jgi:hypothetical protein